MCDCLHWIALFRELLVKEEQESVSLHNWKHSFQSILWYSGEWCAFDDWCRAEESHSVSNDLRWNILCDLSKWLIGTCDFDLSCIPKSRPISRTDIITILTDKYEFLDLQAMCHVGATKTLANYESWCVGTIVVHFKLLLRTIGETSKSALR
jgi:hypothetical protein